ncbi:unnamed protein product [Hydatigera taeniaeformis]|uniref:BHLH domain-containing protein n=1 Tax=Hydatigena taeniaeformis TaxID=6205 RepID=A0A0R3WSR5_HYDTA|nr:unnamed protein product [Hydatigera taeniaeformis]
MPSTPYAKASYAEVASASSIPSTHSSTSIHRVEGETDLAQTSTRQHIECRRVKKQRMERVRRARISDKIAQLHGLALSIVGVDAETNVRAEKVEMLGLCDEVLHSVKRMLVSNADMLQLLRAFHRDSIVTNVVCQSITCDCSVTSQLGFCDSNAPHSRIHSLTWHHHRHHPLPALITPTVDCHRGDIKRCGPSVCEALLLLRKCRNTP